MEWDRIRTNWAHYGTLARAHWSEMTERELQLIDGQREALAGHISLVYGISRNAATIEIESWQRQLNDVS
jgi:uncharacterized protein YjbJ (UPF0337 family)